MPLKEDLKSLLKGEFGYETVGDIAIIDPENKDVDIDKISDTIKKYNPNINVVAIKIEDVSGTYRVAKHQTYIISSRERFLQHIPKKYRNLSPEETYHTEHGIRCLLNINKTYFSSKLGFERRRIEKMVNDGENILLLFAGTGVFGLVIAKYKNVTIDAVEINPYACEYMKKNIEINKLKGVLKVWCMDAKKFLEEKNLEVYDRIIMPAPKDAPTFFDEVIKKVKKGAHIHYYFFEEKDKISQKSLEEKFKNYPVKITYFRKVGSVGTNMYRVVVDLIKE